MKRQNDNHTLPGEKLIYALEEHIKQQEKIINLQEETIQILNQQINELTELFSSILHTE